MNKEELEKVEQLIEQKDSEQLKDLLAGLHPADIAELCNELDAEEARFIYLLLDNETAADVLIEMDEDARNGNRKRKLEYARMSEGNAHPGGRYGRNLLCICSRR